MRANGTLVYSFTAVYQIIKVPMHAKKMTAPKVTHSFQPSLHIFLSPILARKRCDFAPVISKRASK